MPTARNAASPAWMSLLVSSAGSPATTGSTSQYRRRRWLTNRPATVIPAAAQPSCAIAMSAAGASGRPSARALSPSSIRRSMVKTTGSTTIVVTRLAGPD